MRHICCLRNLESFRKPLRRDDVGMRRWNAAHVFLLALWPLLCAEGKLVRQTWNVRETLTDYFRPGDQSQYSSVNLFNTFSPGHMRMALLANDSLPGPLLEAELGDDIEITVNNLAELQTVDIHWHGLPQIGTPWADGAYMVTGCGIPPVSGSHTYKFNAQVAGTRFWHSHVQHQLEWGLFGPLIVHDPQDPYRSAYDEEVVLMFHEWWTDPDALQRGSPFLVNDFRVHLVNGVFGNGTAEYPYFQLRVQQGRCYRLRMIAAMGEDVGYKMTIAGHSVDIIAVEGQNTRRTTVGSIVFYIGSRYDVIFCANQMPGDYLVNFSAVQREELLGDLPPVLQFGFLISYMTAAEGPSSQAEGGERAAPLASKDAGRAVNDSPPASMVQIDVNNRPSAIKPLGSITLPTPTAPAITVWLGMTVGDQISMWGSTKQGGINALPHSPLLFSKGRCGLAPDTKIVVLANDTVVDLVINNVMDQVHPQHLHGHNFWVLGTGYGLRPNLSDSEVSTLPEKGLCRRPGSQKPSDEIDDPIIGDPAAPLPAQVWGCPYIDAEDHKTLNLADPYETDIVVVPAHSWAVIRVHFANPGVWPFHCHKLYHMRAGMEMYFNIGPDVQLPIPADVRASCGQCSSSNRTQAPAPSGGHQPSLQFAEDLSGMDGLLQSAG